MNLTAQTRELTNSLNYYSFDLYSEIKNDNKNLFFSPLSTYLALLIAYEGANSETKAEFNKVLHIDQPDLLKEIKSFSSELISWKDTSNYLNISNAIWAQEKFNIEKSYIDKVQNNYLADVRSVDFRKKDRAASEINQWVSDNTNDLIKQIVSSGDISYDTRLIIANAIYFIGTWAEKFNKNLTRKDIFYSITKTEIQTDFMVKAENLGYFENDNFQFVSIPYKGNDKSFCIILPRKKYGISDIEKKLNKALLDSIFNKLDYPKVNLSLPKFKLETNYSLVDPLKQLGLEKAFTSRADFSGITKEEALMIDKIKHMAYIEIDEEKTEAAAATIIEMRATAVRPISKPKNFKADHPFIFLIIDNESKGIIFMGRFVKPINK